MTSTLTYNDAKITDNPAIFGNLVAINAQVLDLDNRIMVGKQTNWSVQIPASLQSTLDADKAAYQNGSHAGPSFDISSQLSTVNSSDSLITATYNAQLDQIILNSVTSSLGSTKSISMAPF